MADGEELHARIRAERTAVLAGEQDLGRIITEFERSQSRISGTIIRTFALTIAYFVVVLAWLVFARTYLATPQDRIDDSIEIARFMLEVIQNTLLPVVTLVLGFYFGSRKE